MNPGVIRKKFGQFRARHGKDPTSDELEIIIKQAAEEDPNIKLMSAKEIEALHKMLYPVGHLDKANSDDENLTIMDYLSSETKEQPEIKAEVELNKEYLFSLLDYLEPDEKLFIMLKYGLIDGKERDKRQMAASLRCP